MPDSHPNSAILDRWRDVRAAIDRACAAAGRDPAAVTLMAVSKTRRPTVCVPLLAAGQRSFGGTRAGGRRQMAVPRKPLIRTRGFT